MSDKIRGHLPPIISESQMYYLKAFYLALAKLSIVDCYTKVWPNSPQIYNWLSLYCTWNAALEFNIISDHCAGFVVCGISV